MPNLPRDVRPSFLKISRTSMNVSTINAAVVLDVADSFVTDCAIALGSVAPTPRRVHKVEEFLRGKILTSREIDCATRIVSESINPINDVRAAAEYKRQASRALTRDALKIVFERARGG
ncbi:hypothetical protein KEJ21_01710 [Candidatus Bathyarchaeota archaeon]|nr:hypothetical protein [Candidatus Bathyarchaeota archaeon]